MDGFDGDVASMVAMLLRFASLTLAAAVRLPEVFAAQVLHGTGRWHHAAGLCAAEASHIASSQPAAAALAAEAHRGRQRGRRASLQCQNHHAGMAECLEMWP